MGRAVCALAMVAALAGGCRRATLGGGPDAGGGRGSGGGDGGVIVGGGDGGVVTPPADGGPVYIDGGRVISSEDGRTVIDYGDGAIVIIGGDTIGIGDAAAADAPTTDALTLLPPIMGCPSVPTRPSCPADRPVAGGACPLAGVVCEYGAIDIGCRDRWRCVEDQTWQPTVGECGGTPATRCPDAPPDSGAACDVAASCSYPTRTICNCTGAGRPWSCQSAAYGGPDCPDQLPLFGAPCALNHLFCRYGGCPGQGAICCNGSWVPMPITACSE